VAIQKIPQHDYTHLPCHRKKTSQQNAFAYDKWPVSHR